MPKLVRVSHLKMTVIEKSFHEMLKLSPAMKFSFTLQCSGCWIVQCLVSCFNILTDSSKVERFILLYTRCFRSIFFSTKIKHQNSREINTLVYMKINWDARKFWVFSHPSDIRYLLIIYPFLFMHSQN